MLSLISVQADVIVSRMKFFEFFLLVLCTETGKLKMARQSTCLAIALVRLADVCVACLGLPATEASGMW